MSQKKPRPSKESFVGRWCRYSATRAFRFEGAFLMRAPPVYEGCHQVNPPQLDTCQDWLCIDNGWIPFTIVNWTSHYGGQEEPVRTHNTTSKSLTTHDDQTGAQVLKFSLHEPHTLHSSAYISLFICFTVFTSDTQTILPQVSLIAFVLLPLAFVL